MSAMLWVAPRRLLLAAGLALSAWAHAAALAGMPPAAGEIATLQETIARQVALGYDHPRRALALLEQLMVQGPEGGGRLRMLQLARGLVAARSGDRAASAQAIDTLAALSAEPLAAGDASLVRAAEADLQGDTEAVVRSASVALDRYRARCPAAAGCDYRSSWLALTLLARHEAARGRSHAAMEDAQGALELALAAGDRQRVALSRAQAADALGAQGEPVRARAMLGTALHEARATADAATEAQVEVYLQQEAERRGDLQAAYAAALAALAQARAAQSPHLVALDQVTLSDIAVKTGHPRQALLLGAEALPVVRRYGDRRAELATLHVIALAQVASGQGAKARRALDELLAVHHRSGALALEAGTLREFADAFAQAGDLRTALALFHRERQLSDEILAADRDAALAQLRQRYDREAQQRLLTRLERQNALIGAQLGNRRAEQRVWIGFGVAVLLALLALGLMFLRVREANRRLARRQDLLRAQSERDPLTGLANRRRLPAMAGGDGAGSAFEGALLLVDVDHFKRINDQQGHAVGDLVLVELARRLGALVRAQDLVVRWGGEEFLILMPYASAALARELAGRLLAGVCAQAVSAPGLSLRVTVSVGFAAFPLPPQCLPVTLARAIALADMALIHAKREGRNRAIGIEALREPVDAGQQRAGNDFEQALQDGRLALRKVLGPSPPLAVVGASAA